MSRRSNIVCGIKIPPEIRDKVDACKKKIEAIEKIAITYAVQRYDGLKQFGISPDYGSALETLKFEIGKAIDELGEIMPSAQVSAVESQINDDE